jgi:DNA-binding response OmpR family regulator
MLTSPGRQKPDKSITLPVMSTAPFVILYVEDNDFVRESYCELLATPARLIVGVADGAAAREALRKHEVGLLLTDISLPDGSGLDIAREALQKNPGLPVIVCSGHDLEHAIRTLGATAYALKKPFNLAELEALVGKLAP